MNKTLKCPVFSKPLSQSEHDRVLRRFRSSLVQHSRTLLESFGEKLWRQEFGLTPRESQIVSAVVSGWSNKDIANGFRISETTVKHHLSNVFDKLGVSTRLELALFAVNRALPSKTTA